jgi:hypothetical protein
MMLVAISTVVLGSCGRTGTPTGSPTIALTGVPGVTAHLRPTVTQEQVNEFGRSYALNSTLQVHHAFWELDWSHQQVTIYFREGSTDADRMAVGAFLRPNRLFSSVETTREATPS